MSEETCFVDIVTFAKLAEFTGEFITKGISVLVEGRLTYRTWEQDGVKKGKHEIVAEKLQLVWKKENSKDNVDDQLGSNDITEEDIPF